MSLSFLHTFGLSDSEIAIYQLLLQLGESPAWQIVKASKLKRPTVYKLLGDLEAKGLVRRKDSGKIIHFIPASPTELLALADTHSDTVDQAKDTLRSVLPALLSSYTVSVEKPIVRTYEGVKGLKQLYEAMLTEKKPIYAWLQAAEVEPELYTWLTTTFIRKRAAAKIHVKSIVASSRASLQYHKKDVEEYRISKMVPDAAFPFEHEVDVYGDKVAFVHYKKGEPLIGVVISHPAIARTMKAIFDLSWTGAQAASI